MQSVLSRSPRWEVALVAALVLACAGLVQGVGQTTLQAEADAVSAAIAATGAQWTAGITSIARLSAAERLLRCGTILRAPTPEERMSVPVGLTPPAFDWRQKDGADWTSPIRDQGACGSCWDFSAIGVFEALLNIGAANPAYDVNLSEQYILSCCPDCGSCQGGWPSMALEFCRTTGVVTETCLPYSANDTVPCGSACVETPQQIGEWGYLSADVDQIKQAIYSYGPVSACFNVYQDFFYYTSGVYEHVYGYYAGGHAIVIVGWDDASQAWICKNSWGTDWGETIAGQPYTPGAGNGGWFRIRWGNCSIESYETVTASLTSFPKAQATVTVLDGLGHGVEHAKIYVDDEWYGTTGPDGMLLLELISGLTYSVVANYGSNPRLLLYDRVTAPGSVVLDCRNASYVTVVAAKRDGSPLDAELYCETDQSWRIFYVGPTPGGAGWFYITPGSYILHAWSRLDEVELYDLAFPGVDLTTSKVVTIDASTLPIARWTMQTLAGPYDAYDLGASLLESGHWRYWELDPGESLLVNAGDWYFESCVVASSSPSYTWYYYAWIGYVPLVGGEQFYLEAGGDLALSTWPEEPKYVPGETAGVWSELADDYGNAYDWISRYDAATAPPLTVFLRPDDQVGRPVRQEPPAGTWDDDLQPWLTVTPPSGPPIFAGQGELSWWTWIDLDPATELGTYDILATQQTHLGERVAESFFDVAEPAPDPYEPNNTCETAYAIGPVPPAFSSQTAHAFDPNEDWFSFQVTGTGLLVIETACIGDDADTVIWLYDACGGTLLATDDESGPGHGSRIEYAAGPGTYKLLIDLYQYVDYGPRTDYSFTVELRPIPDITVTGAEPIVLTVLEGATTSFAGLLSVRNDGQPGSSLGFRVVEQDVTTPTAPAPSAPSGAGSLPPDGDPAPGKPLPPKLSEPGPEWTLLLVDPNEAQAGPGDIAYVYGQIHDGVLYFHVVAHEAWDAAYTGLATYMYLDVDQDPATGGSLGDIGADHVIGVGDGWGALWKWQSEDWMYVGGLAYLSLNPNSNEFTVGVAMKDLLLPTAPPGASPGLDLLCENWQQAYTDWAPDAGLGHVTYPPSVGFLSCIPNEGTLATAGTSAVTLRAVASALSAGDSRRVRLFFMSNDPDELLTRDVVINVVGGTPAVFKVDSSGIVRTDGSFYGSAFLTGSADVAEWVTVSEPVEPGDVLELDPWNPGHYRKAVGPCSSLVAGVVSTEPGFALGSPTHYLLPTIDAQVLLALVGMVPVKACDENGPIALGDLVVPSSHPGYVMRWDSERFPSCMPVGKALQELNNEAGVILILLMR